MFMNMINHKLHLLMILILILGLAGSLYLVQQTQIFQPKADEKLYNAIKVTNPEGQLICSGNECKTDSLEINISLDIERTERIKNKR